MHSTVQKFICLVLSGAAIVSAGAVVSATPSQPLTVAVVDIDYVDTSGEEIDQSAAHTARSRAFADDLRHDLAATGDYRIVNLICGTAPCTAGSKPADLEAAAREAGVKRIVMVGVHKMSTLVQWGKVVIVDAENQAVVFDKLLTFRGDTDEAWKKAESFTARDILAASGAILEIPVPIKIAVFDFELKDFSGGGAFIPESADDAKDLQLATEAARRLIAQSGRYTLVDVSGADAEPVRAHKLQDCDGCDATIALGLGAEQSLVGIVTRITRTDYAVTFKLRDAQSAKLIDVEQTDLRIGANYSWDRGAAWLIKHKLLDKRNTP